MSQSRPTLPAPVLEAIESVVKTAEHHGWCRAGQGNAQLSFARLQEARRLLTQAIEAHASAMYEGGIEMGRAQGGTAL
jgi:hypothetical protein